VIRPRPLKRGDVVRIVAPSGPFDPQLLEQGLQILRQRFGLEPRMRADIGARRGYLAGDDSRRADEWQEAAADHEARALWVARGGYGAMRLLPRIDLSRLLHPARWLVGFSDVTALHAALNGAGLVTCHGPVITQLPRVTSETLDHLGALLLAETRSPRSDLLPAPGTGLAGTEVIRPGTASGTLIGGSLTLLAHLCGTPWLPRLRGAVLFFEDVGEKPYRLDRYLTQLRLAGVLDGVRGVCVGQLTDCDDEGVSGAETVRELVRALGVPAIEGIPAGHEATNLPLPLGSVVTLVAPAPGQAGGPRLLFDQGARA
jgi:muramoyltetrapeptide carboxypeptidase